jgi:hypothetical protein
MRALGILLALGVLVAAGCGGGDGMQEVAPPASGQTTTVMATERAPAPSIEGTSLDGEHISLADYRGRPVFVNVWSSW